MEDNIQNEP